MDTDRTRLGRSARRAARGREDVLAGASRVIARRGADATRFADVAAETGVAISTLQYSFGNRDDLILAALRHTNSADMARVERALAGTEDPVERMRRFVLTTMRADAAPADARESWLVWVEYWRTAARDADLATEWREVYEQWKALVRPILADGTAAGRFAARAGIDATAAQILALFDGLCVPMVLGDRSMSPAAAAALALSAVAALLACPAVAPAG
jgi:AcrR family transcriptional regulator